MDLLLWFRRYTFDTTDFDTILAEQDHVELIYEINTLYTLHGLKDPAEWIWCVYVLVNVFEQKTSSIYLNQYCNTCTRSIEQTSVSQNYM